LVAVTSRCTDVMAIHELPAPTASALQCCADANKQVTDCPAIISLPLPGAWRKIFLRGSACPAVRGGWAHGFAWFSLDHHRNDAPHRTRQIQGWRPCPSGGQQGSGTQSATLRHHSRRQ